MKHKIITISRQFGSGGRTIGKAVAEKLGIPCYDQQLITMLAEESGFSKEYVQESGETATRSSWLSSLMSDRVYDTPITEDLLWEAQRKMILDLADKGPCVIVGRCADFILKDRDDCLKAYIHADKALRAKRIVEIYGEREDSPEKRIADKDKARAAFYKQYTKHIWGEAENYHIALDSGELGLETCAKLLVDLY